MCQFKSVTLTNHETSAEKKNTNFTQDLCMRTAQLEFLSTLSKALERYWYTQRLLAARKFNQLDIYNNNKKKKKNNLIQTL